MPITLRFLTHYEKLSNYIKSVNEGGEMQQKQNKSAEAITFI